MKVTVLMLLLEVILSILLVIIILIITWAPMALGPQGPRHFLGLVFFVDIMQGCARVETSRPVILVPGWYSDGNPGFGCSGCNLKESPRKYLASKRRAARFRAKRGA